MNPTISPLEFLLVNVICFAAGAAATGAIYLGAKAFYAAGRRSAHSAC